MTNNTFVGEKPVVGAISRQENDATSEYIANIIDKLAICESGGKSDTKTLDSNSKFSYGVLQFQWDTAVLFSKKYGVYPKNIEETEFENWLYDEFWQKELAYKMLEDDINNLNHWRNCSIKLKLLDK